MTYDAIILTGYERPDTVATMKAFGAYKCANMLRKAGYSVLVVDFAHSFSDKNLDLLFSHAIGDNTLMIGISNTFMTKFSATQAAKIKSLSARHNPRVKLVVGGASVQLHQKFSRLDKKISES